MIFRSPYPDVRVPDVPLHRFVLAGAAALGDKPALIDGPSGRTLTYGQLGAGVERIAAGLAAQGFKPGDVLGLFAPNCPEFALAFHGALAAGGVVTTVNSLSTVQDLQFQLRNAGARFLVTVAPFLDRAVPAAGLAGVERVFVLGDAPESPGTTPFGALLAAGTRAPEVSVTPGTDLAALPYSSGTTGLPKGVMLTHRNLVANLVQTAELHPVAEADRIVAVLPFFHIYGLQVILNLGLWRGATLVTMPRFELEDLSSVTAMMSGAAPLDAELETACGRRVGCEMVQGYGLTEASPVTHANPAGGGGPKPGTVGQLLPNTECRIVDAAGGDVGPGEDGELWIRGPQVMRGYLNNPEATAAMLDPEGWLHTGDIGRVDLDGYFTIVDRLKELIKYKGFQVAPAELEAMLCSHPAVADAAVVPMADDVCGEVPKAFVVLKGDASPADLMAYVAERVAPYKKIRVVEIIDAIPKSPSGKILRRVLREREHAVH